MGNTELYEFRDVPITALAMKLLIVEHFSDGKAAERKEIIKTCLKAHLDRGGIASKSEIEKNGTQKFKSATANLEKSGLIEKAPHKGYWRVTPPPGFNQDPRAQMKLLLYVRQEKICKGCKKEFDFRNFTVDQIVPKGGYKMGNVQLLCGSCNSVKGDRPNAYLLDKLKNDGII